MRKLAVVVTVLAGLGWTAAAEAKLTAVEQKWATPMIAVWNQQNLALHVVLQAAAAKDALIVGTTNNKRLTIILNTFVVCGSQIKKGGAPPSPRLTSFAGSLKTACTHDTAGATDFAKSIGAIRAGKSTQSQALLKQGVAEFKLGTAALSKAYKSLTAIGGRNIFKA
jgi:hypothetical protein